MSPVVAGPERRSRLAGRKLRLLQAKAGVTAVEYGIVAAFLCLSLLGIFSRFGVAVSDMFNRASSGL